MTTFLTVILTFTKGKMPWKYIYMTTTRDFETRDDPTKGIFVVVCLDMNLVECQTHIVQSHVCD